MNRFAEDLQGKRLLHPGSGLQLSPPLMKKLSVALLTLGIALVVAFLNAEVYSEYFGDGPPYFARTTNMDKWSNPLPVSRCLTQSLSPDAGSDGVGSIKTAVEDEKKEQCSGT